MLGYSSRGDGRGRSLPRPTRRRAQYVEAIDRQAARAEILADDELARFADRRRQARPSRSTASQCHGTGAPGSAGYPNLNDDDSALLSSYSSSRHIAARLMVFSSWRRGSVARARRCRAGFRAQQLCPDFTVRILGAVHIDVQLAGHEARVLCIGQPGPGGTAKLSLAVWVRVMIAGPFFPTAAS